MDPLSTVASLIKIAQYIKDARGQMQENHAEAKRLCDRVLALEPVLLQFSQHTRALSESSIRSLEALLKDAQDMVTRFVEDSVYQRGMRFFRRGKYAAEMAALNARVTQQLIDLQVTHAADVDRETLRKEDLEDAHRGLAGMVDVLLQEMESRGEATQEALAELQEGIRASNEAVAQVLQAGGHRALAESERAAMEGRTRQLLEHTDRRFSQIMQRLDQIGGKVDHIADDVAHMLALLELDHRSTSQEEKRIININDISSDDF